MEGCPGSYLTRRQLACHRLSCRSLFSRCLRGYFKVRVGARKSCPPPWQSSIEGSAYTRRGRTAALPSSASLPSRRVRRQHAHTVLECDLPSTSDSSPVVVTTANLPGFMWAAVRDRPCGESLERYLGRCCSSHPEKTVFFVLDEQLYTRRRAPFFLRQSSHTP